VNESSSDIGPESKPLAVFEQWMALAKSTAGIREATAMTVTTSGQDGALHSRVVLCKKWTEDGFYFYTNYNSRKGRELGGDAHVSLLFYFDPLFRQIKISGKAVKTSREDSENYWRSRPRASQLSQYISRQSEAVGSREELESLWAKAEKDFAGQDIPCPGHWGGYLVRPQTIEFWIGRPNRLHDRFEFEKGSSGWTFRRLYP
jgi:pyridoxamine 5'-phosphate oxidase